MTAFDQKYWNLSQAAAWVVYRRRDFVEEFEHQSDYGFASLKFYPTLGQPKQIGSILELEEALRNGRVRAMGRRSTGSSEHVEIPESEWRDLSIRPPRVVRSRYPVGPTEPWRDIILESAELRKLWRGTDEVNGRRRYDPEVIHALYSEVRERLPDVSKNRRIDELQREFEARFDRQAPSPSRLKEILKGQ